MAPVSANEVLNRLLVLHHRSLIIYLADARPWAPSGREHEVQEFLTSIVIDRRRTVDELGELLNERHYIIHYGEFPLYFTGYHDVSFDFVLKKITEQQKILISRIEESVSHLSSDEIGRALAERALGAARAHLEMIQQAAGRKTAA